MPQRVTSWSWRPVWGLMVSLGGIACIAAAGGSVIGIASGTGIVVLGIMLIASALRPRPVVRPMDSAPGVSSPRGETGGDRPRVQIPTAGERFLCGADYLAPAIGELCASFNHWFAHHDAAGSLWPQFERWLRDALSQFVRAHRVRGFRRAGSEGRLVPMAGELGQAMWLGETAPSLIQHVVETGQRFVHDAPGNGALIQQLEEQWATELAGEGGNKVLVPAPVWIVPIIATGRTTGVVVVGDLPGESQRDLALLQAVGNLIELFWSFVEQAEALAVAQRIDQASGVLSRADLTECAESVIPQSITDGEPMVVLILAVEGIRRLDDERQWSNRDWLVRQIATAMRRRLRTDDLIGRFSDDTFVAVLRRLDVGLGKLIAEKLLVSVREAMREQPMLAGMIHLRCALCEVDDGQFGPVLGRAFSALQQGRQEKRDLIVATRQATSAGVNA